MKTQLSKLENVDIRSIWKNEASDFTPWLARPENINRVGDVIGMDLTVIEDEKRVGPFKADIFCKDENSDNLVVIENQLEATNHNHLGQILTYASGLNAASIVWIASEFEDEHRAVLDWLNEHTEPEINFFGVRLEVVKINDSPVAPHFSVSSAPNDWTKNTNNAGYRRYGNGRLTENRKLQQDFWTSLNNQLARNKSSLSRRKPVAHAWHGFSIGSSEAALEAVLKTRKEEITAQIIIRSNKSLYKSLEDDKEKIESEFGEALDWRPMPNNSSSRIGIHKTNFDLENEEQWNDYVSWLIVKLEKLYEVFSKRLTRFNQIDNVVSLKNKVGQI